MDSLREDDTLFTRPLVIIVTNEIYQKHEISDLSLVFFLFL